LEALEKRILLAGDVLNETEYVGDLGSGINGTDSRIGEGYLMFTQQAIPQRFATNRPTFGDYSDHFIAVLFENNQWKYDANYYSYAFTPQASDVLVASVNFTTDTVTDLKGTDTSVEGILAGYSDGDLTFFADRWNGYYNEGEFEIEGTYFDRNVDTPLGIVRNVDGLGYGVAGNDSAQGTGHILFSVENVYERFSPNGPAYFGSADHLIGVINQSGQWFYDDNYSLRPFTPNPSDVLIAELNYTNDTVTDLAGTHRIYAGITEGYSNGDLQFTANVWNGNTNYGEFGVTGSQFVAWEAAIVTGQTVGMEEDERRVLTWDDFGVDTVWSSTEFVVRLDSAPTHGTIFLDQEPVSMGEFISRSAIDRGALVYVPLLDNAGIGTHPVAYTVLTVPGSVDISETMTIQTTAVSTVGSWELVVLDASRQPVSSVAVGDQVTVQVFGKGARSSGFRGGYVDIGFDDAVLQWSGDVDYQFSFLSSSGLQIALPNRIQSVGGFASSFNSNRRDLVAELSFEVIGGGESGLKVLPPRDLTNDLLLTNYDQEYRPGQVDYLPVSLVGVGASSQSSSTNGIITAGGSSFIGPIRDSSASNSKSNPTTDDGFSAMRSIGTGNEIPWEFVELDSLPPFSIDLVKGDSTPLEATEPNRVFRQTPQVETSSTSAIGTNDGTLDVIYLAIKPAELPPGAPQVNPYPADFYIRVTEMPSSFYRLYEPFRSLSLNSFVGPGGHPTYFGPFSGGSNASHLIIVDRQDPDIDEALKKKDIHFEIVYQTSNGAESDTSGNFYSSTPEFPALEIEAQTKSGTIKDNNEFIQMVSTKDAIESPAQDGKIEISLMPTTPVIATGLDESFTPFSWDSSDNYFNTRWQLILQVDTEQIENPNGTFQEQIRRNYADPLSDFALEAEYQGAKTGDPDFAETRPLYVKLVTPDNSDHPIPIGKRQYYVSDILGGEWIHVAGTRETGIWDQININVIANNDLISVGVEVFDAFLAAEVELPPDLSHITGRTELTKYLRLAETQARILDDPQSTIDDGIDENTATGAGELEVDGLCECSCTVCASGTPVNLMDGSVQLNTMPAGDTGAYRLKVSGIVPGDALPTGQSSAPAAWQAETPIMVNNSQTDYDLAPGFVFPFEHQLVVGTIGGGSSDNPDDQGASLFRANQTASYFPKSGSSFITPAETFEKIFAENGGYVVVHPDSSEWFFEQTVVGGGHYRIASILDATGNRTHFNYATGTDRISSVIDPLGRSTLFHWPSAGGDSRQLAMTDWRGRTTNYDYDATIKRLVVTHPTPTDADGIAQPALIEQFQYDGDVVTSVVRSGDNHLQQPANQQTKHIRYRSYGPNGSLMRADSIEEDGGELFNVNTIGIDDALPDSMMSWLDGDDYNQYATGDAPFSAVRNKELMTAYWSDYLDTSTSINDASGFVSLANQYAGIPRQSLSDFENYASFTQSGYYLNSHGLDSRLSQFVLDRRGRTMVSKDPLGNVTTYEREPEYESGTGLVTSDRGEVLSITGPDPDVQFISPYDGIPTTNGPLLRPVTSFEYVADGPFIRTTTLPRVDGQLLQTETTGYVNGQPTRVIDELGNGTFTDVDGHGNVTKVYRQFQTGTPLTSLWQNTVNRFNVSGEGNLITPLDALRVINELNNRAVTYASGQFVNPTRQASDENYYDVNGDGYVTAVDALQVINELNRRDTESQPAGDLAEETKREYVGSAENALLTAGLPAHLQQYTTVDPAFQQKNLIGAEIITTGRVNHSAMVTLFLYHLDDADSADHGRLAAVIQTEMIVDETAILPSFDVTKMAVTTYQYDAHGYPLSMTDPIGRTTHFQYDLLGRLTKTTSPQSIVGVDHGTSEIPPLTPNASAQPTVTKIKYDPFGNVFQTEIIADTIVGEEQTDTASNTPLGSDTSYVVPRRVRTSRLTTYLYDVQDRLVTMASPSPDNDINASAETSRIVALNESGTTVFADGSNRPIQTFRYDDYGQLRESAQLIRRLSNNGPLWATTLYDYDELGRTIARSDPQAPSVTDPANTSLPTTSRPVTQFQYSTAGYLIAARGPSGIESTYEFDSWGRGLLESIGTLGNAPVRSTATTYRRTEYLGSEELGIGSNVGWGVTRITSDAQGTVLAAEKNYLDRDGRVRQHDVLLEQDQQTDVFGGQDLIASSYFRYHADGTLESMLDPEQNETRFTYDHLSRLDQQFDPDSLTDAAPGITTYHYDLAGQLTRTTNSTFLIERWDYDLLGNLASTTVGLGNDSFTTDYDYDGFSQLVRTVKGSSAPYSEPSGSAGAAEIATSEVAMTYYDRLARPSVTQNGFFETTSFEYDLASRRTGLTDASGNLTQWVHDDLGRVMRETTTIDVASVPTDVHRDFYYDPSGNLVHRVDRSGRVTRYQYDELNQLQSEQWYAALGTSSEPLAFGSFEGSLNYDYDAIGRLQAFDDAAPGSPPASHAVEMNHDGSGRVTDVLQSYAPALGNGFATTAVGWQYEYDRAGLMKGRTTLLDASMGASDVSGTVDHHDTLFHDGRSRLSEIQRRVGPIANTTDAPELNGQDIALDRLPNGLLDSVSRTLTGVASGQTLVSDYVYSHHGRVEEIDHTLGNVHQSTYTVAWDNAGRAIHTTGTLGRVNGVTGTTNGNEQRTFQYDQQGQLAKQQINDDGFQRWQNYSVDPTGNRLGEVSSTVPSTPSTSNEIASDNRLDRDVQWDYTYDNEGNLTGKQSRLGTGLNWTYQWDHRNRLTEATLFGLSGFETTLTYYYDALDRLIGRVKGSTTGTTRDILAHDGGQVGLQLRDGVADHRFLWSEGVDQLLAEQDVSDGSVSWTLTDYLGSVRDRITPAGTLQSHTNYDAYGDAVDIVVNGPTPAADDVDVVFGFTGRLLDETTSLQNNHHRWYDSQNARWLSNDPSGLGPDSNPYRYARNQPTTLTDPSGLEPPSIGPPSGNEPKLTNEPWFDEYNSLRALAAKYQREGGEIPFVEGSRLGVLEGRLQRVLFEHNARRKGYGEFEIACVLTFRPGGDFDKAMSAMFTPGVAVSNKGAFAFRSTVKGLNPSQAAILRQKLLGIPGVKEAGRLHGDLPAK